MFGGGSPYLGLDLRLDTSMPGLFFSPSSPVPVKPVNARSFDVEVLTATLNPQVKDFDTILMYTLQVSSGGRTFVCSKTFGDLRVLVNKVRMPVNSAWNMADLSSSDKN